MFCFWGEPPEVEIGPVFGLFCQLRGILDENGLLTRSTWI